MRGYGTKLVWNSVRSTLSAPSKRSEAVIEETTLKISNFPPKLAHLRNETVEVGVRGARDAEVLAANVVDGLVVDHEGAVRVLQRRVRRPARLAMHARTYKMELYGSTTAVETCGAG